MKQCPVCKTTYTDDSLQFCLADGTALFSPSSTSEVTQQFSGGTNPIRVNIARDETPTIIAKPASLSPEIEEKKGRGWNLIFGLIGGFFVSAILAAGMFAGFLWWQRGGNNEVGLNTQPSSTATNSITKSPTPDEAAILKEKIANLERKVQEQKNTKPTVPTISNSSVPQSTKVTARVNSPGDGFLALRTAPSAETGDRILQIPHGATVTVNACLPKAPGKKGRWCKVEYNGNSGWAFDGFLIY